MSLISYNLDIPNAPNNPSNDQPDMKTNTNAINQIIGIDHVTFNTQNSGTHLQVTYSSKNVPPTDPTDPTSITYTDSGTATTTSELFYQNQNTKMHLSCVKAWGYSTPAAIINNQSYNVDTVAIDGVRIKVTLISGTLATADYAIMATSYGIGISNGSIALYQIIDQDNFYLTFIKLNGGSTTIPTNFSFIVLQI